MSMLLQKAISVRACVGLAGVASALIAPWWVPALCMLFLALRYPAWEVLFIGILVDLIWLPGTDFSMPLFTIGAITIVWLFAPLRDQFLTP